MPSCMRAPPVATTETTGTSRSMACSKANATFSPTTEPMLPPRNPKSITIRTTSCPWILPRPVTEHVVETALRSVGLWNDLKDRLHSRATGLMLEQQQKLCIARLVPLKPEVILMDEPCSALDVEGTRAIEELMLELKQRYTIVVVTHNMAQARRVSDECAFMLLGRVVEHSRTADLFLSPRDPRTAEYIEGRYG